MPAADDRARSAAYDGSGVSEIRAPLAKGAGGTTPRADSDKVGNAASGRKVGKGNRWNILRSQLRHQGLWLWLARRWRFRGR